MSEELQLMKARIAHLGEVGEAEARRIVQDVYADGIVSREEAEALFQLDERLSARDRNWSVRFIEAIKDFLLMREAPHGQITQEEADWLETQIGRDGHTGSESEIDLMLALLQHAEQAPQSLSHFCLNVISGRIIADGVASDEMAERMRQILSAPAGDGSLWVTRHEANALFTTNDAIARASNSKTWNTVFARAILNHLLSAAHPDPLSEAETLARDAWLSDTNVSVGRFFSRMANAFTGSWFNKISSSDESAARARFLARHSASKAGKEIIESEQNWLLRRLGWDKSVSQAERQLIDLLKQDVPGFARGLQEALKADDAVA